MKAVLARSKDEDEYEVEHDVEHACENQGVERCLRVAAAPKNRGREIVEREERHAREVDAQVDFGRRLHGGRHGECLERPRYERLAANGDDAQ